MTTSGQPRPTFTRRNSTVKVGFTTKTNGAGCPVHRHRRTTTALSLVSVSATSTNWPGHSASSCWGTWP